ncbi:hypothetical protein PCASD_04211 [Puccinia coronata f. sp. avenae]|uniref:Uncharacterized protein n=1 Tax=Puccinia coronata f. sp. avenae TaxID=200324 RepID=A0A2N5V7Y4_9BASI|nr:hypothetical protein PCASD_04211 [Puccinia coronata f. sp. avenae]
MRELIVPRIPLLCYLFSSPETVILCNPRLFLKKTLAPWTPYNLTNRPSSAPVQLDTTLEIYNLHLRYRRIGQKLLRHYVHETGLLVLRGLSFLHHHSPDVFYKKSRPYVKISVPPGYIENQALCQQFGISPHSLLCLEPALWRQQIVDQVVFDLSKEYLHISLINGSTSIYSFEQCQQILDSPTSLQADLTSTSSKPSLSSKIKPALLSHLEPLLSFLQRGELAASDLNQLCRMSTHQLAIMKKEIRPYPLTPTAIQVALDDRRSQQEKLKPILVKKKISRRKPSAILGAPKNRKRNRSAPTPETENLPPRIPELTSRSFHLEPNDLHQLVYHLTGYRSTLVDFFQSVALTILRAELPQLYSLWVLESQIQSLHKAYKDHSQQFARMLHENKAPENFQRFHSSHHQPDLLRELEDWCQAALHSCEQDILSSADTTLNEQSSTRQTIPFRSPLSSPRDSISHLNTCTKDEKIFPQDTLPPLPVTSICHEICASPNVPLSNNIEIESLNHDHNTYCLSRERTPSLSPPPDGSSQSRFPSHSILHLPFLILEQAFLSCIESEKQRESAIELGIKLSEERLEIDKLEESAFILKLLEEERQSREQFSGISRLSDIITTSRLSAGLDGSEANIAQHATIKGALMGSKPTSVEGSSSQDPPCPPYRPPSKSSELKRRQCMKRKTWLAATRRLSCRLMSPQDQDNPEQQVWPEPIFLKTSSRKRRQDEIASATDLSLEDGARSPEEEKRRKKSGEVPEIIEELNAHDESEASSQVTWVELESKFGLDPSTPILVSEAHTDFGSTNQATTSLNQEQIDCLVTQGIISELCHPIHDDVDDSASGSDHSHAASAGERSDDLTTDNLKLFTTNDKVFESLTDASGGSGSHVNDLSEVDSEWPR